MPCRSGALCALSVLAVAAAIVLPLAGARPAPTPTDPEGFRAEGEWSRFRAYDGTECIPDEGSGTFEITVARVSERQIRLSLDGIASCASLNYQRGFGGTWVLDGRDAKGYRWENRAWCAFVRVGPLPDSPDDAWRVEGGEYNEILGGCEVFEGTARIAEDPLLGALPIGATPRR